MTNDLSRDEVDTLSGTTLLEFGAAWCPICQAARPLIDGLAKSEPGLRHVRVEDGKGKPLGRSFRVKLWPTLIVLREGQEVARVVRPNDASDLEPLLSAIADRG
jgi:thioredoxin 1